MFSFIGFPPFFSSLRMQDAKAQDAKRKKKKLLNERRKLQEKMKLKMVLPGDSGPSVLEAKPLFALDQIKSDQACTGE